MGVGRDFDAVALARKWQLDDEGLGRRWFRLRLLRGCRSWIVVLFVVFLVVVAVVVLRFIVVIVLDLIGIKIG